MPPSAVIVSGVELGDLLAHMDTSTTPPVLPPSERSKSDCHLSTFMALSPQCRLNIQAGTTWGRPGWRGGARSSSTKGRSSSWWSPPATMPPPPPGQRKKDLYAA